MAAQRSLRFRLFVCLVLAAPAFADSEKLETVSLIPEDRAGWSATNLFAPVTGLFMGGPGYWYRPRRIEIRSTPPGAALDLFYVRRNFQKGYEQADAPVAVLLPKRIEAGPRDYLTIRAFMPGYRQTEVKVKIRSRQEEIMVDLEPLANSLVAVTHLYFGGRASLGFLTDEALSFRVQERDAGYAVVLLETGTTSHAESTMQGASGALIESLRPQQLGEDLTVRIQLREPIGTDDVDLRSRQSYDAVRRLHRFSLDVVPRSGGADSVRRAREALARIVPSDVSGCAARFDTILRQRIEPSALARALAPRGSFTDPYLRAAMKRLGEVSPGGTVVLSDGTGFRTSIPLELAAASSQASEVTGYLALLRRLVEELEAEPHRRETLRGLIAPELSPAEFETALDEAEVAERSCLARAG
jgi:hypothetical protein